MTFQLLVNQLSHVQAGHFLLVTFPLFPTCSHLQKIKCQTTNVSALGLLATGCGEMASPLTTAFVCIRLQVQQSRLALVIMFVTANIPRYQGENVLRTFCWYINFSPNIIHYVCVQYEKDILLLMIKYQISI